MSDDRPGPSETRTSIHSSTDAAPVAEGVVLVRFESHDGVELSYARTDLGDDTGRVLVFLHGIGSHGGLYYHMAEPLRGAVDSVYFPDLRGHGLSHGSRGLLVGRRSMLRDIGAIVQEVRAEHPAADVVLGGESMGGLLALGFAADQPGSIDALVLAAPALKLNTRRFRSRDSLRRGAQGLWPAARDKSAPAGIPVTGSLGDEIPRDPALIARNEDDPLVLKSVSLRYLLVLATFIWNWAGRYPHRLAVALGGSPEPDPGLPDLGPLPGRKGGLLPVLILQGGADVVLDPAGARRLNDLVPQAEYAEFGESWHNLFWDPESPRVLARMAEWLRRLGPASEVKGG
jgi:alpha-beta hydrolase superfamily lysophospholipase